MQRRHVEVAAAQGAHEAAPPVAAARTDRLTHTIVQPPKGCRSQPTGGPFHVREQAICKLFFTFNPLPVLLPCHLFIAFFAASQPSRGFVLMVEKQAPERDEDIAQREDRDLIAACLAGDASAWESLVARYQRLVYSIPLKARLSNDDAADIFQSVWLKLYEKLDGLRDHEKLSSWLITTTTREVWRVSSRNRRDIAPTNEESDSQNPLD